MIARSTSRTGANVSRRTTGACQGAPFTPDFEILPGTAAKKPAQAPKPFEVRDLVNPTVSD